MKHSPAEYTPPYRLPSVLPSVIGVRVENVARIANKLGSPRWPHVNFRGAQTLLRRFERSQQVAVLQTSQARASVVLQCP